jgi:formate dehydrogenase major subunit
MLRVNINGHADYFPEGTMILAAARALGFHVPTLCFDDRLSPSGACRLCVVQVRGVSRLMAACSTLLTDGMEIETGSDAVIDARTTILKLLARNYPAGAIEESPDKEFHRLLREYDIKPHGAVTEKRDTSHPYISVDPSRCIKCFRCVRACAEIQGQFVWQIWNRGAETAIRTRAGSSLSESDCVSCGSCVDVCPTGALEDKSVIATGTPTTWTHSTCPYCGVGCEVRIGTRENHLVQIRPAHDSKVNRGHLCVKGRYAFGFNSAPDRVAEPMIRRDGAWEKRSWIETIDLMGQQLSDCVRKHGPNSVGVLSSARGTNEENYLAQKFARVVLGTNNVDCCARVCHAPTATAMSAMLGTGAATNSFDDIERASAFLVCGCNPTENHPIVGERIKQATLRGAKLIVIDPRRIELCDYADVHLALKPGTNVPLLNAIAATIIEEKLYDERFVSSRSEGFQLFADFVERFHCEKVSKICGVSAENIRAAARLYAKADSAMSFHGLGVTEHRQGSDGVKCLVNLALLTGNFGKPGAGVNPLRGQNNVQGAAHMGCEPNHLAGYPTLDAGRSRFEAIWHAAVPKAAGLDMMQMIDAACDGALKALWVIGYDIAMTNPNSSVTGRALRNLEFLAVQDLFMNETARYANVFLPAASPFERSGTFMNSERRVQRIRGAVRPPGNARPDWRIICDVATAMGKGEYFNFNSPEEIWNEIREVWPGGKGITYERLDQAGLQWPCPDERHPGTALLHEKRFGDNETAKFALVDFVPSAETVKEEFPFLLTTGRTLMQFNAGTMTGRTRNLAFRPTDTIDLSSIDADSLHAANGDLVRIISRVGETTLPVRIDDRIKPGEAFATFHDARSALNNLIGAGRDADAHTPEYKVVRVHLEKFQSPL